MRDCLKFREKFKEQTTLTIDFGIPKSQSTLAEVHQRVILAGDFLFSGFSFIKVFGNRFDFMCI
nr:MAG TPA: hypothetical protein [Bacteriophage sp.]